MYPPPESVIIRFVIVLVSLSNTAVRVARKSESVPVALSKTTEEETIGTLYTGTSTLVTVPSMFMLDPTTIPPVSPFESVNDIVTSGAEV